MARRRDLIALGAAGLLAPGLLRAAPEGRSVRELGAAGDGMTDDSAAFQRAIDAGTPLYVPRGTYIVGNLRLRTGTRLRGEGSASVLLQVPNAPHLASINPGEEGSPDPAANVRDVVLEGLQIRGRSREQGFSEHRHLLNFNGCSDVRLHDCIIAGFRGDGLYLGSGNRERVERHNRRVRVERCIFDGDNRENRNALTVVDCEGLVVEACRFHHCSRPGMPGAIDIEPGHNTFHVVRDIAIRGNAFTSASGGVGTICAYFSRKDYATPVKGIVIEDNVIEGAGEDDGFAFTSIGDATEAVPAMDWVVRRNRLRNLRHGFQVAGLRGVRFEENVVENTRGDAFVSHPRYGKCRDVVFRGNEFRALGRVTGRGIRVLAGGPVAFLDNRFVDCGYGGRSGGFALDVAEMRRAELEARGNRFEVTSPDQDHFAIRAGADPALRERLLRENTFGAGIRPLDG